MDARVAEIADALTAMLQAQTEPQMEAALAALRPLIPPVGEEVGRHFVDVATGLCGWVMRFPHDSQLRRAAACPPDVLFANAVSALLGRVFEGLVEIGRTLQQDETTALQAAMTIPDEDGGR